MEFVHLQQVSCYSVSNIDKFAVFVRRFLLLTIKIKIMYIIRTQKQEGRWILSTKYRGKEFVEVFPDGVLSKADMKASLIDTIKTKYKLRDKKPLPKKVAKPKEELLYLQNCAKF